MTGYACLIDWLLDWLDGGRWTALDVAIAVV
jgi:hypothetical protein